MQKEVRQAIQEGAFGLGLLRVVAEEDALFTVHGRAYIRVSPFYKPSWVRLTTFVLCKSR
jgi:hypothetical protein